MMSYINETDFVIENKQLVYPEIITDGLQLYYDAKGKRDTDYHRDTMLDMSGNKNHGKLHNFAYEKHSGYKDGLVFDYIDDKLVRPTLNLQPNDFTFMLNGNIISFSPDGTVKRVQDWEVIESKGFNMIRNGDFVLSNHPTWRQSNSLEYNIKKNEITITGKGSPTGTGSNWFALNTINPPNDNSIYYITALAKGQGQAYIGVSYNVDNLYLNDSFRRVSYVGKQIANNHVDGLAVLGGNLDDTVTFKEVMAINLTKTFGAGNEPTKEQMDEIVNRFRFIPNAQDLIDRIEYKGNDLGDMENIIDGLYKTEVLSGEEVYTDKSDDAVVHVDVDGKSLGGGSGKNLLTNNSAYWKVGSLTTMDGSDYSSTETLRSPYIELKKGTYTLSVSNNIGGYSSLEQYTYTYDSNKNGIGGSGWSPALSRRIEIPEDGCFIRTLIRAIPRIQVSLGDVGSMFNIQLEEGSTATAYEPPAPTPDYPVEIHSLNDFDVVSSVGKENLLPASNNYLLAHNNNGGIDKNSFDSATGIGKLTLGAGRALSTYNSTGYNRSSLVNGKIYTFSIDVKSDIDRSIYIDWRRGSSAQQIKANEWVRISYSREYNSSDTNYLWGLSSSTLSNQETNVYYKNPKVEEGVTKNTKWTPHLKSVAYDISNSTTHKINLLLDEPLRSVGEVKDRLFRDSDGVWKIERRVGESVYDGSDDEWWNFQTSGTTYNRWALTNDTGKNDFNRETILSSHFNMMVGNNNTPWHGFESRGAIYLYVSMDSDLVTTPTWRAWLSENPVTVLRKLAEPHVEILSQPLQDKLNNLRSFEGSNYVYTVLPSEDNYISNNLKPTLHAKFLYNNWYKEDRVINNLMIYNRALTNQEMLQNYKTIKRRWGM